MDVSESATDLVLYTFRRCPYAMRARLALLSSRLSYEAREVDLKNKPLHMLTLSPKGTVPVLVLPSGTVIEQSLDIMLWALRQHDPQGWLPATTAALLDLMDLVITVDTSIAHLAGAMGKPVWILLPFAPDWRWLLDRDDSPWYPTMRLFRQQSHGDWDGVFSRIVMARLIPRCEVASIVPGV